MQCNTAHLSIFFFPEMLVNIIGLDENVLTLLTQGTLFVFWGEFFSHIVTFVVFLIKTD